MENINKVMLAGRLTADAIQVNGKEIINFSIANNQRSKDADGTYSDKANFFDFVMYGKRALGVLPYLKKGTNIFVEATARQDVWEKDGKKGSKVVFRVENIELGNTPKAAVEVSPIYE